MSAELMKKVIGVPLEKSLEKDDKGFLKVRWYFTSDARDEVGDVITKAATKQAVPIYRQWGNIRRMHAPDPVGRVLRIGAEDGLSWNEVEILVIDPKAAFEVENGLLKALSVGILVNPEEVELSRDGGWVINEYSLAETSLVDHPANYDARLFLGLNLNSKDRMLVRQLGVHGYLAQQGNSEITHMEENNTPAVEETVETPAPVEAEKDITAEQPAAEEAPVVEEPPADEAPVADEVPAEEAPAPVAEEAPMAGPCVLPSSTTTRPN